MQFLSIIPIIVTFVGVASFAVLFTILYKTYANSQIEEIKSGKRDIEIIDEVIRNRDKSVIKRKKIFKIVKTIFYYATLSIVVPLFIFSLYIALQLLIIRDSVFNPLTRNLGVIE